MTATEIDLSKAASLGHDAAKAGKPYSANPYAWPEHSAEAIKWAHAWLVARVEAEEACVLEVHEPTPVENQKPQ